VDGVVGKARQREVGRRKNDFDFIDS